MGRISAVAAALSLIPALGLPASAPAQESLGNIPPMVFAVPRIELSGESQDIFDGLDLGFAVPLSDRTSVTGGYVIDFNGDDDVSATYNWEFRLRDSTAARLSAGFMQDGIGVGISGHRVYEKYGAGAFLNAVEGDFRAGMFLTTPLSWGIRFNEPAGKGNEGKTTSAGKVSDLGALTTMNLRVGQGTEAELVTGTAWYPRLTAPWPRSGGDASSAGSAFADFSPPAKPAWSFSGRSPVRGGPVIANDLVYTGGEDGSVQAVRLSDGTPVWTAAVGSQVSGAMAVGGDRLYVGTRAGHLVCLRPPMVAEGIVAVEEWRFATRGPISSCPVVTGRGLIIFGSEDGTCYALDTHGRLVWSFPTRGPIVADLSLSQRAIAAGAASTDRAKPTVLVYCPSSDGTLYALREPDGRPAWTFSAGAPLRAAGCAVSDRVAIPTESGAVFVLDASSGRTVWRQSVGGPIMASPAASDGRLFVAGAEGALTALNLSDGRVLWTAEVFGPVRCSPIATRSQFIMVASEPGMLYALRKSDGRIMWADNVGERITTAAAVGPQKLIFGTGGGAVRAFEPGGDWHVDSPPVIASASAPTTTPTQAPAAGDGSFPSPVVAPGDSSVGPEGVSMTLLTATDDPHQPPILVSDRARLWLSGAVPADTALVTVNGAPADLDDNTYRYQLATRGPGAYPVAIKIASKSGASRTENLIVAVSPPERPASPAPVFVTAATQPGLPRTRFTVSADRPADVTLVHVLEIKDQRGKSIRAWADVASGSVTFAWDGCDQVGKPAGNGQYLAVYSVRDMAGRTRSIFQPLVIDSAG